MPKDLKWYNLKNNKCPQCGKDLMKGMEKVEMPNRPGIMITHPCGFKITEQRMTEIVNSMVNQEIVERENE